MAVEIDVGFHSAVTETVLRRCCLLPLLELKGLVLRGEDNSFAEISD